MRSSRPLSELIDHLYRPRDLVQAFLNAYALSEVHWNRIFNLLRDERHAHEYGQNANELRGLLSAGAAEEQFKKALRATSDDGILLAAFALLTALARHIAQNHAAELSRYSQPYRSSTEFGDLPYWLSLDRPGLLGQSVKKLPRDLDGLHETLHWYHGPLLVTPAEFEEWKLTRVSVDRALENEFERRMRNGGFRIAVSPLSYDAEIDGASEPRLPPHPPHAFHLTSVGPSDRQEAALTDVLSRAHAERAAILVLPELRMPPSLVSLIKNFLRNQVLDRERGLLLVAAGSWHIEEDGRRYNRCAVLNQFGEQLWSHDKLREFVITQENVEASPAFFARIGVGAGGGSEAISRGLGLEFYDSVIGRVAAAICIGFFSPEVEPLLRASDASVFLVPTMTPAIGDVEFRARGLVRSQHAFTLAANCGRVGPEAPSFCCWPATRGNLCRLTFRKSCLLVDLNDFSAHHID